MADTPSSSDIAVMNFEGDAAYAYTLKWSRDGPFSKNPDRGPQGNLTVHVPDETLAQARNVPKGAASTWTVCRIWMALAHASWMPLFQIKRVSASDLESGWISSQAASSDATQATKLIPLSVARLGKSLTVCSIYSVAGHGRIKGNKMLKHACYVDHHAVRLTEYGNYGETLA
ncbi:uncharacterized protein FIBRA_04219 [Fibroporia radiculosa]|uniref:Uncharacterized protein n=1 Tax=Fibroporia radiculosa TaxID=599839 RepID=J4HWE9_9APHY|nr:uncharacterized protein FIBRA_04219 [Fibroporia radiculosa]CCM02142.1 predicted protein [Fibroporia radiculosa]